MACFIVPAAEAIVTTCIQKAVKEKEKSTITDDAQESIQAKIPTSRKLSWLNKMLWGGCALLAFEHVWHGEISLFFPFLTAMESAEETAVMLHEMSTVGVSMALLVTVAWTIMVAIAKTIENKSEAPELKEQ